LASIYRGLVVGVSGAIAGMIVAGGYVSIVLGVYVGAIAALISFLVGAFSPMVEFWADNLPERTIAAAGVVIMLTGMALQSAQYFLTLFNIPVR
jgi:ABC-type dipeptide/oligopeptide/nickel transport system permease subunit